MKRGWILLILIPIVAVATVFAWSIESSVGIIVLAIGIIVIISISIYLIRTVPTSNKDPLAERLRRLEEQKNVSLQELEMSISLRDRLTGAVRDIFIGGKNTETKQRSDFPEQQVKGRKNEDVKISTEIPLPPPPPEPEPTVEEEPEEEEEDLIVFGDVDDEIDDAPISMGPPIEKPKPDNKPQQPPAPQPAPGGSLGSSERKLEESKKEDLEESEKVAEAQFTAYYARQSAAKTDYGFYVYAHLPEALISADIQQFAPDLGGRIPKPALAKQTATLQEGVLLTAMIHCDSLEFNQIGIMKKWEAPFVRFDFRYTAPEALIDEFVEGRVAIMLGMIEIASIDFQTLITAPQPINLINTLPDDPTQQNHFEPSNPASMYQKIFISYSRKDTVVAEESRKAQIMMGNTVFMDTHTIRAGEDWEEALKRFIREADVFQLFWSEHSASSAHCKFEWDYALSHRCSETRCVGFIRPAYWEKPLPSPPTELGHLHFAYVPQEGILT